VVLGWRNRNPWLERQLRENDKYGGRKNSDSIYHGYWNMINVHYVMLTPTSFTQSSECTASFIGYLWIFPTWGFRVHYCHHVAAYQDLTMKENVGSRRSKRGVMEVIGWREWVALPDLKISKVKVKIDTGARSSCLHAFDLQIYKKSGKEYVKFKVHPSQRNSKNTKECRARVFEYRKVKSSNGQSELRPVIVTNLELLGDTWPIEITLTNRDEMGFRMLLGRESFRKKFLVDAGSSYYGQKLNKPKRKRKK
jgi:hypothetical protein